MAVDKNTIRLVKELDGNIHEGTREYYHTRPMVASKSGITLSDKSVHSFGVVYDLKNLFSVAAFTNSSLLMTGGTDKGKTFLAKLVMNALLGREEVGWHRIDIDTDFGKDTYTDTDFSAITDGKSSADLYSKRKFLSMPGLILDEINRDHAALANKLLHVFDRDISLPNGERAKVGVKTTSNGYYQFQIAAINEGRDYGGTFEMDKAMRRRTVIEIPMDLFSPTNFDRARMKSAKKNVELNNDTSHLEQILAVYEGGGQKLPFHISAEMFLAYLESFDFCRNSLTGGKDGVASKGGSLRDICSQQVKVDGQQVEGGTMACQFLRSFPNDMCSYVQGITPGISKNLMAVARGFALLRAVKFGQMVSDFVQGTHSNLNYILDNPRDFNSSLRKYAGDFEGNDLARAAFDKYINGLEVEIGDVEAALGFVGYSKMGISTPWVIKHFQGNMYAAIRNFSLKARSKFEEGLIKVKEEAGEDFDLRKINDAGEIFRYCNTENPWLWRVIEPYTKDDVGKRTDSEFLYKD